MNYKRCAGLTYFRTIDTHCTTHQEKESQRKVVFEILKHRGFPHKVIELMNKHKKKIKKSSDKKKFLGKLTYDHTTNRVKLAKRIIMNSGIDFNKHFKPVNVSWKKLHQHIFTLQKMKKKLQINTN